MATPQILTPYQSQYIAWLLTHRVAGDSVESLASTLVDSQVDLNPHQVEAALFACANPLSRGVILADEVGLGKTIEAGLVIAQRWAERRRRILIIVPANLRKQWHQELQDKFHLQGVLLETKSYNALRKGGQKNPFKEASGPVICSYQFAKTKAANIKVVDWDLVVLDEAHRLRNVYKTSNVIAKTLKEALAHVDSKVLLTATPLQNSLLELYGLVGMIDDRIFADIDSFRAQFTAQSKGTINEALRARLAPVCKRTLRRQVQQYVPYTARRAIVEEFTPSPDEQELSNLIAEYLRRPNLHALPDGQRQLISLVLWKLLASSSHAIAGALETMIKRLEGKLDESSDGSDVGDTLDDDYESFDETAEEWGTEEISAIDETSDFDALKQEIKELRHFKKLAINLRENAKGTALLTALDKAFAELDQLGAPKKAIIFTESKRTQEYLLNLLADTPYAGPSGSGIVLFNGTNSDARAQAVYKSWLKRHAGSDRITGSKTADTRAALVEHFKDHGTIMIATEAGAEGINLQFCSLVINYDLPWNPQRIEQRIGRCHRYGQKFDVVVVNFVDRSNEADARVYELLAEKFQLFEGVFGASDEVLGAIGSGVDFERRIVEIYQKCRNHEEIQASFEQLQRDLSSEINEAMVKTRQILLENFDEEVQEKLRIQAQASREVCSKYERMLLELTHTELGDCAVFNYEDFTLKTLPDASLCHKVELGRYQLPRRSGDSHVYRLSHPLAEWVIEKAKSRCLDHVKLVFDYEAYGNQISTLKAYRGQNGWLTLKLLTVVALEKLEQHLIVAAITADGVPLEEDDPEKLLRFPATMEPVTLAKIDCPVLEQDVESRKTTMLREINQRNLGYFEQEVQKLDAWADDLKLGLEQEIKDIDAQIKDVRRTAATAATLDEKLSWQKQQRELEAKRTKLRRELFNRQDAIESERNDLINQLEDKLQQEVKEETLFTVEWELI